MEGEKRNFKRTIIIIVIAVLALNVLIFGCRIAASYFVTDFVTDLNQEKCGEGGYFVGNSNEGWYCHYYSECEDCQNATQCPNCTQLCESRGKVEREGVCFPKEIDITGAIKINKDGLYIEELPVMCNCCCDELG